MSPCLSPCGMCRTAWSPLAGWLGEWKMWDCSYNPILENPPLFRGGTLIPSWRIHPQLTHPKPLRFVYINQPTDWKNDRLDMVSEWLCHIRRIKVHDPNWNPNLWFNSAEQTINTNPRGQQRGPSHAPSLGSAVSRCCALWHTLSLRIPF